MFHSFRAESSKIVCIIREAVVKIKVSISYKCGRKSVALSSLLTFPAFTSISSSASLSSVLLQPPGKHLDGSSSLVFCKKSDAVDFLNSAATQTGEADTLI